MTFRGIIAFGAISMPLTLEKLCDRATFREHQAELIRWQEKERSLSPPVSAKHPDATLLQLIQTTIAKKIEEVTKTLDETVKEGKESPQRLSDLERYLLILKRYEKAPPNQIAIINPCQDPKEKIKGTPDQQQMETLLNKIAKTRNDAHNGGITFEGEEKDKAITVFQVQEDSLLIFPETDLEDYSCFIVMLVDTEQTPKIEVKPPVLPP